MNKWFKSFAAAFCCVMGALMMVAIIAAVGMKYGEGAVYIASFSFLALIGGTIIFHEEKFKHE